MKASLVVHFEPNLSVISVKQLYREEGRGIEFASGSSFPQDLPKKVLIYKVIKSIFCKEYNFFTISVIEKA